MTLEEISNQVAGLPFIRRRNARYLYNLILNENISNILELGIAHGTATCYMAAALQEKGGGKITCVDLLDAQFDPSAEDLIERVGLSEYVTIHRYKTGYNWFLHDNVKENSHAGQCKPIYDLCIIDGPKNWTIDGFAFFLVDKLLHNDGWIIFDDYNWTHDKVERLHNQTETDGVPHHAYSREERMLPQIQEVFELLVMQHPNYSNFSIIKNEDWAIAQKIQTDQKTVTYQYIETNQDVLVKIRRGIKKGLKAITRSLK